MKEPWIPLSFSLFNLLLAKFPLSVSHTHTHTHKHTHTHTPHREKREMSSEIGLARKKVKIYTYCMSALWRVNYYFAHIAFW